MSEQNPFDELGLDPTMSAEELTRKLRERAQPAPPEEHERIKALWRELTLKDRDRAQLALRAHPRSEETPADDIDALFDEIPPVLEPVDPPEIRATVSDVLLDTHGGDTPPDECGPPSLFGVMASREDLDD